MYVHVIMSYYYIIFAISKNTHSLWWYPCVPARHLSPFKGWNKKAEEVFGCPSESALRRVINIAQKRSFWSGIFGQESLRDASKHTEFYQKVCIKRKKHQLLIIQNIGWKTPGFRLNFFGRHLKFRRPFSDFLENGSQLGLADLQADSVRPVAHLFQTPATNLGLKANGQKIVCKIISMSIYKYCIYTYLIQV